MTVVRHGMHFVVLLLITGLFLQQHAFAEKIIHLATSKHEPYVGDALLNQGCIVELVTEALNRVGYKTKIDMYPLLRAKLLVERGRIDGMFPYVINETQINLTLSAPFPGDVVGLLKKQSLPVTYPHQPQTNPIEVLKTFKEYRFGLVRGVTVPVFEQATFLQPEFVKHDLQNIDKLAHGHIDFAVIDKYTAADILVNQRPHLIGQLEFLHPPLTDNAFHVAFANTRDGAQQRIEDFNRGLQTIIKDGTLNKIYAKHGLFLPKTVETGKTKLTIGTVNNSDMLIMQRLSTQFEQQHPHISLEWRVLDENTLRQRLLGDLAVSDGQFDIMTIGAYEAPIWAQRGWLTPIENLPASYDLDDVLQSVRNSLSYQDTLYAIPFYAESSMTFYRSDLFKKAGISMPAQPTYAQIKQFAAAIHDPTNQIYGICLRGKAGWGENMAFLTTLVNTFGGRWFDEQWQPTIDSDAWQQAVMFYQDLLGQYGPPQASTNGFNENLTLFRNGQCGMWIDATVAAGMLFNPNQSKVYDKLGFAPAPIAVTPKGSHWLWTWALAIPKSSKHQVEAMQFITWATSKVYIQEVAKREGWVAVPPGTRQSTYANLDYQAAAPFSNFVLQAIQNADPLDSTLQPKPYTGVQFVGIPEFPAIGRQVGLEIAQVLDRTVSVEQALRDAQAFVVRKMWTSGYFD